MKKFFKRFSLSEWLILTQLLLSAITLILTTFFDNGIVDILGLVGNIINGIAILVVFSIENTQNIKYYELTGQFIFNKLGENFSSFMDYLMSEEYKKMPFDEHKAFRDRLLETAKSDNYDSKRKLARALPYLYDIDKSITLSIVKILRNDICENRTDIRRRTLEALLTIIQKQQKPKNARKLANTLFEYFSYFEYDDSYTIVACIENYYFLYEYVYVSKKDKLRCIKAFNDLKCMTNRAFDAKIGTIETVLCDDMDNIWTVLSSLSDMQNIKKENYFNSRNYIEQVLSEGKKFSKLTVVKNLFYTCEKFPECLYNHSCSSFGSKYMIEQIDRFLTNALDKDVFLCMPTVRYFDCICNNINKNETRSISRGIIHKYFSSDELLIAQTAFDKFGKLLAADNKFAQTILTELLHEETQQAIEQSDKIKNEIDSLPDDIRTYFSVELGRKKIKVVADEQKVLSLEQHSPEIKQLISNVKLYNNRIRFIGKIKKMKEDHGL